MGLGRLVGSPADAAALRARADRHLATLADLTGSVDAATCLPTTDENLVREAEDAALGLRLHTAAYAELMTSGTVTTGTRGSLGSLADAS
jgi:hypothetical protein